MAAFSGTAGSVSVHTSGTAYVTGISEWSFDLSMSPPEATTFSDSNDVYVPSVRNATGSFSGNREQADGGQNGALDAMFLSNFNGGTIQLRLYETSGKYWLIPKITITGMSPTLSIKGKGDISYNFQSIEAITYV